MLQSTSSSNPFISRESPVGTTSNLDFGYLFEIFKRRFFYFLIPFGLISTVGLYVAAIQSPSYLSEGKILLEADTIAPDIVRPVVTSTNSESVQLIEQRVTSRDTLLSIANKFGLYPQIPQRALVLDLMRRSVLIKPDQVESRSGRGTTATRRHQCWLRIRQSRDRDAGRERACGHDRWGECTLANISRQGRRSNSV